MSIFRETFVHCPCSLFKIFLRTKLTSKFEQSVDLQCKSEATKDNTKKTDFQRGIGLLEKSLNYLIPLANTVINSLDYIKLTVLRFIRSGHLRRGDSHINSSRSEAIHFPKSKSPKTWLEFMKRFGMIFLFCFGRKKGPQMDLFNFKKKDIETSKKSTTTKKQATEDNIIKDDNGHIEIHGFRKPLDISKSSLSLIQNYVLQDKPRLRAKTTNETIKKEKESWSPLDSIYKPTMPIKWLRTGSAPDIAYEVWHSPPEVYDWVYGFDADCEPPDRHRLKWNWLYRSWGYYSQHEVLHRCTLYSFMKAQRRCARKEFWQVFDLENTFRVELQLLGLHLWFVKCRCVDLGLPLSSKLSSRLFKMMVEQLPNRFRKNIEGLKTQWQQNCEKALLHLMVSLDNASDDFKKDDQAYAKTIWKGYTYTCMYMYTFLFFFFFLLCVECNSELYLSDRDMDHDVLYLWTEYILREKQNLEKISRNDFFNGWWAYGPVPSLDDRARIRQKLIDGHSTISSLLSQTQTGTTYYF
ncbi:hypothetical protein RFI_26888 [Reticulomyxa filosa]|uniref:Ubiquinol-cytochrome c chaperone domain-containing protein n=1 Tax=Reticulomyxa filosa TaxID=46433 RepID=X6MAJ3_RETFI|nr:hypothetical protein RFI_26888 [Reticulomyxa filosa]|eukprot:ETO10487.1 hypothetical protein RFI_26888 [Reticulomyxa filosa]